MKSILTMLVLLVMAVPAFGAEEALAEVNAFRAARGLKPFAYDEALTQAAKKAADYRAQHLMFGHLGGRMGDFALLPAGASADAAGCAAYPPQDGWLSCCARDAYSYAGAAWTMGRDGKRYMHIFVANRPNAVVVGATAQPVAHASDTLPVVSSPTPVQTVLPVHADYGVPSGYLPLGGCPNGNCSAGKATVFRRGRK